VVTNFITEELAVGSLRITLSDVLTLRLPKEIAAGFGYRHGESPVKKFCACLAKQIFFEYASSQAKNEG
jgi:hypothetical protein